MARGDLLWGGGSLWLFRFLTSFYFFLFFSECCAIFYKVKNRICFFFFFFWVLEILFFLDVIVVSTLCLVNVRIWKKGEMGVGAKM